MLNTVNLTDGLDGLATGVVGITALFITIISFLLGQQSIAILSAVFTGAVFGFLPHNWNPAKIFMGDSGSMFLGLGLAVLSIMGGAKLALALMVLGIPILDLAVVAINRIRRGQSPLHYDTTHLHYRMKATGLSVKQICLLFYGLTIMFGLLALRLDRIFKFIGLGLVGYFVFMNRQPLPSPAPSVSQGQNAVQPITPSPVPTNANRPETTSAPPADFTTMRLN